MGTRGAWGFRINGKDKVTYNHFDSYPEGLGTTIVEFAKRHTLEEMKALAKRIILVKQSAQPTKKQKEICAQYMDLNVDTQSDNSWYCLLRNTQGDPEVYFRHPTLRYMIDSHEFLSDSLWCEWAYIINIDTVMLEVYRGFNCTNEAGEPASVDQRGRYWNTGTPVEVHGTGQAYYGVRLIAEVPLVAVLVWSDEDMRQHIAEWSNEGGGDE